MSEESARRSAGEHEADLEFGAGDGSGSGDGPGSGDGSESEGGEGGERGERKVGWLELFYDLVFAAAVITFSDAVSHHPDPEVIGVVSVAFGAVWLIWVATTLYVNAFGIDDTLHRILVVAQMLLLTLSSLAIGDGLHRNPELASVAYGLLVLDVGIMYGRHARRHAHAAGFARLRRNQYGVAAIPILAGAAVAEPARIVLWVIGIVIVGYAALGFRVGHLSRQVTLDEGHLSERMGLLTIIVLGEAFVKVSLVVTDGSLEGIDVTVLVALFVVVFAIWVSYFDDVPQAGIRAGIAAAVGWLLGHLAFQLFLIGVAIAYAKWLQFDEHRAFTGERSLLGVAPFIGFLLALAVIGCCTRREPRRVLASWRVGTALFVAALGVFNWRGLDTDLEVAAIGLAVIASVHAGVSTVLQRRTQVPPAEVPVPG